MKFLQSAAHERILLRGAQTLTRGEPRNLTESDAHLFAHEYETHFDEAYCAVYKNALVVSKGSATCGLQLVSESIGEFVRAKRGGGLRSIVRRFTRHLKLLLKVLVRAALYKAEKPAVPRAMLATDHLSSGYFHWICDVLPKIILLRSAQPELFASMPVLVPHAYHKPYCRATLAMLGIPDAQIIVIPRGRKVRVGALYAVGDILAPAGSGNYRPDLMRPLRNFAWSAAGDATRKSSAARAKRIYISRADAAYRYLTNEHEIIPLLKEFGFEIITASSLDVTAQIALCMHADALVSMHGAGLTNMAWMREGAAVGEIRAEGDAHNNCYFSLADALGLSYRYCAARTDGGTTQRANFTVDAAAMRDFLASICAAS